MIATFLGVFWMRCGGVEIASMRTSMRSATVRISCNSQPATKAITCFYLTKMELEKDVPKGSVLREGEIISMEEWLKEIKKSYVDTKAK